MLYFGPIYKKIHNLAIAFEETFFLISFEFTERLLSNFKWDGIPNFKWQAMTARKSDTDCTIYNTDILFKIRALSSLPRKKPNYCRIQNLS